MKLENNPDVKDLILLQETLESIAYKEVVKKNLDELTQRYGKSADTLIALTFKSDFRNELEILKEIQRMK